MNTLKYAAICILLASLTCCAVGDRESEEFDQPNIILIFVDDLGKEWVSCYGAEDIQTLNIDRLAAGGIRFDNVYGMPQCTPSRVTLLTGQYPYRHGWVNHWDVPRWGGGAHFDETVNPALTTEMKKAGYKTCIAGKWQIDDFRVEPDALTKIGFDEYCMWTGGEGSNPPSNERYFDPYIFTKEGSKTYEGEFGPDIFADFILEFITDSREHPMFIYFPMVLTHGPYTTTPIDSSTTNMGKHKAMVNYVDKITGDIVQRLEDENIRENTLIIWTTDNGSGRGISGMVDGREVRGGKGQTVESGICLPFIANWPAAIKPNQTSEALIDFTDILPTFLDLAGISIGSKYNNGNTAFEIDGVSFKNVLIGKSPSERQWILSMGGGNNARLTEKGVENQFVFRDRVVRDERYKLMIDPKNDFEAFYDLQDDPAEQINLIDSVKTGDVEKSYQLLSSLVEDYPQRDSDPRYVPNPPQEWDVKITAESQVWKK